LRSSVQADLQVIRPAWRATSSTSFPAAVPAKTVTCEAKHSEVRRAIRIAGERDEVKWHPEAPAILRKLAKLRLALRDQGRLRDPRGHTTLSDPRASLFGLPGRLAVVACEFLLRPPDCRGIASALNQHLCLEFSARCLPRGRRGKLMGRNVVRVTSLD
jgi:hypothetical protein